MRTLRLIVVAAVLIATCASGVRAQAATPEEREAAPGAALAAAFANIVFMPVRLAITVVGAELGGFTGFMTGGNQQSAEDVWHLFRGDNMLTADMMQGEEALRFGDFEFHGQ